MKSNKPIDLTIAVTYRCNLKCRMCDIWNADFSRELKIDYLKNLSPELRYVNISGGEPFLHPEIVLIVSELKKSCPKAAIIISTNGFATELIKEKMARILRIDPKIGVRVSLDGLGKIHDEIRGAEGVFDRAKNTLLELKKLGVDNLGIGFTAMEGNASEIKKVYDLANALGVQFALGLVQNSQSYFKKTDNAIIDKAAAAEGMDYIIKNELFSWNPKKWLRAFFTFGLMNYLMNNNNVLPWRAGIDSLFIDPEANVYPSHLIGETLGNIGSDKLESIWSSAKADDLRKEISQGKYGEYWVMCAVRQAIRKHWFRVGIWIMENKIKRSVQK